MKKHLFTLFFLLSGLISEAQDSSLFLGDINTKWEFLFQKSSTDSVWLSTSYQHSIYCDLQANKIIPNNFLNENPDSFKWVSDRKWKYRNTFSLTEKILKKKHIVIRFNGLDTYCTVWLNGNKILESDNMFRSYEVDVKTQLKKGENQLLFEFTPPSEIVKQKSAQLPYELPGQEYSFHRKAAFGFGWDFAPKLISCGVWKRVELIYWGEEWFDDFRMTDVQLNQRTLTDSFAIIDAILNYKAEGNFWNESYPNRYTGLQIIDTANHIELIDTVFYLSRNGETTIHFKIKNPRLWWCNGYGEPYLYHLKFILNSGDGTQNLFTDVKNYGARTIKLIQQYDSIGSTFYFLLNGERVFVKGANYVPPDATMNMSVTREKNQRLISLAKDAHMNMLRVWGGGFYPDDDFYNLCDENGIMVWQDFMFACAMYPGDTAFSNTTGKEIIENVLRIRNHPSLALWCGNNEIKEGWFNWDWQRQFKYSFNDSAKIWSEYRNLFDSKLPLFLKAADQKTSYWSSSPSIGWGHKESLLSGDSHYWGVWWGMEPFDSYINHTGRFASEYGFQSFPSLYCLQSYLKPEELYLYSPALKVHQKHATGFETIQTYLKLDFDTTLIFDDYVYLSQLLQAKGMSTAIEAHRRAMPYCMGTMFWQLNDCWPAISWSCIDFSGQPKAFYYQLNRLYNTYLLSLTKNKNQIECWIISDSLKNTTTQLQLELWSFSGKLLWKKNMDLAIDAQSSKIYFQLAIDSILKKYDSSEIVLHGKLLYGDKILSNADYFFASPKNLKLQKPEVNFKTTKNNSGLPVAFTVSCKKPVLNFYISATMSPEENELGIIPSDNYFNLFPNEKKEIKVNGFSSYKDFEIDKIKVQYKCLNTLAK